MKNNNEKLYDIFLNYSYNDLMDLFKNNEGYKELYRVFQNNLISKGKLLFKLIFG